MSSDDHAAPMLRFVVLHHEGVDPPHFDLMFETSSGSPLATWRSERWPIDQPTILTRLGEHRRAYLDYEGPVSENRGHVTRIVRGQCEIERRDRDTFWTIHFADPMIATINIKRGEGSEERQGASDKWLAVPICGA